MNHNSTLPPTYRGLSAASRVFKAPESMDAADKPRHVGNHSHTRIKICGVKSPHLAEAAVALGADYIGLVFHPASKRHVDVTLATSIAKTAITAGAIPVAVFVDQDANAMQAILDVTGITMLQLHGDNAKASHHQLDAQYARIYVQAMHTDGSLINDITDGLRYCLPERDYLLFDSLSPGKGVALPWDRLKQDSTFRYGLAGGLNPNNVVTAIQQIHPDFVDVSSGVEIIPGEKDITLIKHFIEQVRGYKHAY